DLRADDADQHDPEPIDACDVAAHPKLKYERCDEECGGDERRVRQTEPDVPGEIVRSRLTHGRAQDLDEPEVEGDFRNLVEHLAKLHASHHARNNLKRI